MSTIETWLLGTALPGDEAGAARAGFTEAVRAEWIKLRSVRSTTWSVLALIVGTVGISAFISASVDTSGCPPPTTGCDEDTVIFSLGGVYLGQIAAVALGVLAISGEYGTRMIRTTFAANPRRRVVLGAKALVVAAIVGCAGLVACLASLAVTRPLLEGNGFTAPNSYPPPSLADEPTLRAFIGTVVYLVAVALLSLGVAALVRHTAAAITAVLGLLYVPMIVGLMLPEGTRDPVLRFAPMTAGLAVQRTVDRADSVPIGVWAGLGVACAYAAATLLAAVWLIARRDA